MHTEPGPRQAPPALRVTELSIAIVVAVVVTILLLRQPAWPREAAFMAGIFVLAALLWVTEALPLFATALLIIGLEIVLLGNPGGWPGLGFSSDDAPTYREILAMAADPVLLLFFGGFLLARAAVKEGVDHAMSALLLRPFGGGPLLTMLGVMLVTALFSMWMSNTATTVMMIALVTPMLAQVPRGDAYRKGLVLAVPVAANIGGIGTPIGSPPNAVAIGFLQKAGLPVAFLDWMLVAVPLMLGLIAFAWLLLARLFPPTAAGLRIQTRGERLTPRAWFVVATFTLTVALWLTDHWHGLPAAVVALVPAVAFTATGVLDRTDVNGIQWNILILIAGGIALGGGMQMTGLDTMVAAWLPVSGEGGQLGLLATLVVATIVVGTFMSNTAAANLLLPIGLTAAATLGGGSFAVQVAMSIALAASMTMALPVSTPPNAIGYATGEFAPRDLALVGIIVGVIAALLIVFLGGPALRFWGVGG
jgi:solute carrier family 13 (sodium-dependent dicarboxylate transporter), member 2/3/5